MRLDMLANLCQNSLYCIGDSFIGVALLGRVYHRQVNPYASLLGNLSECCALSAEAICLACATFQNVALVGTFVEFLGHREHHLDAVAELLSLVNNNFRYTLHKEGIAEGIDKTTPTLAKHSANGFERTQSLTTWECEIWHIFYAILLQ